MGKLRGVLLVVVTLLLPSVAAAQQAIRWENTLDAATRAAGQSNRLVMLVFSAPWCTGCRAMEAEMASQPAVAAAIEANYVAVKLNYDYFRPTAKQYGVTSLPTTLILAPGAPTTPLATIRGWYGSAQFTAQLNQVAATRQRGQGLYASIPAGAAIGSAAMGPPAAVSPASAPRVAVPPAAVNVPVSPRETVASGARPSAETPALPNPPLGLAGFCPVVLVEKTAWTRGDRRWGAIHRGRTYLFTGADQQRRFLADPDRYAPVNAGDDVVVALEQGRSVPGNCNMGVVFGGRVYLFVDEQSLAKFSQNPRFYAERALGAIRDTASIAPPAR